MSHIYQHKKRNSSDSSESSASSSDNEKYDRGQYYDQCRACIVCPPYDYKEKYESSGSDYSCPDFSDLCEDKPRICVEKKEFQNEYKDSSSSDSHYNGKSNKCHGCNRGNCRQCNDHSISSVVNSLGHSDSDSGCPTFEHLASDVRRQCTPLFDHCKPDDSTKDASSDNKNIFRKKSYFNKKDNQKVQYKRQTKQSVKDQSASDYIQKKHESNSSSASASASRGKKFIVSFGPKEGHQWSEYNEGDESIHINGKNGPVLHLYRGSTYFFCVKQSDVNDDSSGDAKHFFFLTNSPIGGVGSRTIQGGFAPVSKGCVCFKVDKTTPRYFFYQSSKEKFEGGLVIVHDK